MGGPRYRVRQIADWLHGKGAGSFDEMRNLPRELRDELSTQFTVAQPVVVERTDPAPDESRKYLYRLSDGNLIEAVYMPMGDRVSICVSSQAGCAVGCTFCVTGFFGGGRDLTPAEMMGQINVIRREQSVATERLNVVFMGMGEPLLNVENMTITLENLFLTIAPKRVTLSTSGIIPGIDALAELERRPNLAVSVNAPDQERRERIMPITRKYPLDELIESLRRFPLEKGRDVTVEYVLLAGFNDSMDDARMLARLLRGLRCKVNAIPFNPDPNLPEWMIRPGDAEIDRFVDTLVKSGVPVTVRRSKGLQISAACGQLRGRTEKPRRI